MGIIVNLFSMLSPIYVYTIVCVTAALVMRCLSVASHQKKVCCFSKALFFLLCVVFVQLFIVFSSFRYIRISDYQFSESNGYFNIGGIDSLNYKEFIEETPCFSFSSFSEQVNKEWLFTIVCFTFAKLNLSFELFLCFINFFVAMALIKFSISFDFRNNSFLVSLLLVLFYIASFNTLRWSVSLLFTVYFLDYMVKEKYLKAFITIIFLFGIQEASVVLVVPLVGFIFTKKLKRKKLGIAIVVLSCFVCYLPSLVDSQLLFTFISLTRHTSQIYQEGQAPLMWIAMYSLFVLNIIFARKTFFLSWRNKCLSWCVLFLIAPTFIELTFGLAYRFSGYGHVALYVLLPYLLKENKSKIIGIAFNAGYVFLLLGQIYKFLTQTIYASGVPYIFKFLY